MTPDQIDAIIEALAEKIVAAINRQAADAPPRPINSRLELVMELNDLIERCENEEQKSILQFAQSQIKLESPPRLTEDGGSHIVSGLEKAILLKWDQSDSVLSSKVLARFAAEAVLDFLRPKK